MFVLVFTLNNIMMNQQRSSFSPGVLEGKVVVITGASSGVGYATALAFARHKTRLVLASRREQAMQEVVQQCQEAGSEAIAVTTDVTKEEDIKQLAAKAVEFGGRIDVWVNNAGVLAAGDFSETPMEVHEQVIRINLLGYLYGAHAVLPFFKQQGSGVLINNISVGGWFPTPYMVAYSASKFAVRGFSESLRGELAKWPGIYVCEVYPGFLDTPGIQHAGNYSGSVLRPAPPIYDPQKVARAMVSLAMFPKHRMTVGGAASLLRLIHFLVPGLSSKVTARVIEAYLKKAESTDVTSGNLFQPVKFGSSIHGGWNKPTGPGNKRVKTALVIGSVFAGLLIFAQAKRR